uniref:ShTK domain protein n=1 Tax=Syphacia muris TaxID=451379 RepID=A0A0N5AWZ5_9BILA
KSKFVFIVLLKTSGSCVDLAASGRPSDCPANAKLCQDALYKDLMRKQCPKTCGYCTASGSSSTNTESLKSLTFCSTTCLDLAASGRPSDCPQLAYLCNNAIYADLMAKQCPKTCNLC